MGNVREEVLRMRLRPVFFVVLLLAGFYLVTTHLSSTGGLQPWLTAMHAPGSAAAPAATVESLGGTGGQFDLSVASAAPAYDEEEQQNIAVRCV